MDNKIYRLWCILLSALPVLAWGQSFDLTTNALGWPQQRPNLQLQWTPLQRLGVYGQAAFHASRSLQGDFTLESDLFETGAGLVLYPFGRPYQLHFKDQRPVYLQKKGKTGCPDPKARVAARGLYLAACYVYQRQNALFRPAKQLESPIAEFPFQLRSHGALLGGGYHLRAGPFTLGLGGTLCFSNPRWTGPMDIFKSDLYSQTYPVRFRMQGRLRLDVGFHF